MKVRIIKTKEDKEKIELLRKEVFELKEVGSYYLNELLNNKEYAFVLFDNDIMIAGIYFHRFKNALMIDQVFVKKEYQNKGIATNLIKKLLSIKSVLEELLGEKLNICRVESNNKSHDVYIKIGFNESNNDKDMLHKTL